MATMEVLLLEEMETLGSRGQLIRVKAGYGRNYLLPRKMAVEATDANRKMIDQQRKSLLKREAAEKSLAEGTAAQLQTAEVVFARKVGEHGILYGSVTAMDIAEALTAKGFNVDKRRVNLKEALKTEGDFEVAVKLHRDVTANVKVVIKKEE
jgi:large subunit ribosomal protein L9